MIENVNTAVFPPGVGREGLRLRRTEMSNHFGESAGSALARAIHFNHPDDVLDDTALSIEEKRAMLASWASDSHALPDAPTLRQLESGAIVDLDQILSALRSLDGDEGTGAIDDRNRQPARRLPANAGRHGAILLRARKKAKPTQRRDDDDDPPPSPRSNVLPVPSCVVARCIGTSRPFGTRMGRLSRRTADLESRG